MTKNDYIVESRAIERLRRLWAEVLELPETSIGLDSNFWLQGGTSFRAMSLIGRARQESLSLKMRDVWEAPTLAEMAAHIEPVATLAMEKATEPFSLLSDAKVERNNMILLAQKQFNVAEREIEDIYPCTPWQQELLPSPSFLSHEFDLAADVDGHQFKTAWNIVVNKNPILRTRFLQDSDGKIWQCVLRCTADWNPEDTVKPWKLSAPSLRLELNGDTVNGSLHFGMMIHRALTDDCALHSLFGQVAEAYKGANVSYQPFDRFTQFTTEVPREADAFWTNQFKDCSAGTFPELPSPDHRIRPTARVEVPIPLQRDMADTRTIVARLQLSWAVLLSLYTQNNDVVFGVTSCGRTAASWTETISGPTTASYPLRLLLNPNNTVSCAIKDIQMKAKEAAPHEHVGSKHILSVLAQSTKETNIRSLLHIETAVEEFPAVFASHNESSRALTLGSYAIALTSTINSESMIVEATVDPEIISKPEARRLLHQLRHIYHQTESDITISLADIDLLSAEDRRELQVWNSELDAEDERCVHHVIEEQCRIQPEAPAVCAWDGNFSYSELGTEASILARTLVRHGVSPGTFAAIYFDRTRWTAVAFLGIMMAGGTVVMLDPTHPKTRLEEVCADTCPVVVLASTTLQKQAAEFGIDTIVIGDEDTEWKNGDSSLTIPQPTPDHGLYVALTSGSTGKPKGAVVTHGSLFASIQGLRAPLGLTNESRVYQFSSHAFDAIFLEYIFTLFTGGCVCIPTDQDRMFNLHQAFTHFQANWICLTPSVARTLKPNRIPSLLTLACAGESMARGDVDIWPSTVRVINMYGPSECSLVTTIMPNVRDDGRLNNIGDAPAAACWIVDPENPNRLMPIGTVGELIIQGPIVGAGYLNRPEVNARTFIKPLSWMEQFPNRRGRLYRTGDLVRYFPDGTMTYVARKDTQVKLRGQRIELEEVEYHVKQAFSGAQQVVAEVIRPESGARPPILLAFIFCERMQNLDAGAELFTAVDTEFIEAAAAAGVALQTRVPSFMIPSGYIPLAYLPQTATTKLNRRVLVQTASLLSRQQIDQYVHGASTGASTKSAPATAAQLMLQQLVANVLQLPLDKVDVDDHFFRLGGDSILAVQLAGDARDTGFLLTGPDIFVHPKIRDLSEKLRPLEDDTVENLPPFSLIPSCISQKNIVKNTAVAMGLRVDQIQDIYPCTPMQEGLMALSAKSPGMYIETFPYYLKKDIDLDMLRHAFASVVAANSILRTRITSFQGQCLQVVVDEDVPVLTCQSREQRPPASMGLNVSLVDATLVAKPCCFVLRMHHSLYDGQSMPVLWRQIVSAYQGSKLAQSPFNRFIGYLERASGWETYWQSQFEDLNAPMFPKLPSLDYVPDAKASMIHRIDDLQGQPAESTLSTAIRLAWAVTQSAYTDSNDVVYGIVSDGRRIPFPAIENVSGPTLTSYPLRVQLHPETSIEKTLMQLQAHIASAFPYEHAGLQNIQKLSGEAALACDFQCQLGIQPELEAPESQLATLQQDDAMNYGDFSSYALVVVCHPQRIDGKRHVVVTSSYDANVVDTSKVKRILGNFEQSLRYILQRPDDKIRQITTVTAMEWQVLEEWNGILPQSFEVCLHDLVLRHGEASPAAPAVSAWDGDWDYETLASLSLRVAQKLRVKGVGHGDIVPICFEKSKWAVLAMMGVLRAGAAVTTVDPKHSPNRIMQIISQVNPPIVLASATTAQIFGDAPIPVLTVPFSGLEGDAGALSGQPSHIDISVAPNEPAFIIFTSGSTGKPKGIVLEHRNLSTSIRDHSSSLVATTPVRGLHFASYAFDASIYELFTVLCNGGCVCIPSESQRLNGIEEFIRERNVNWAIFSPSTLKALQPNQVPSLQTLILGGEPLTLDIAHTWSTQLTLINGYGPAEATICAAGQVFDGEWKVGTIGPVTGGVGWITRSSDPSQLLPIGAVGELLIEGPVVSRGYLHGPGGGFIDPPQWLIDFRRGQPGKVYRTGDIVRLSENGSICFVGRNDSQVKLRGQRIELHEVEYALRRCFDEEKVAVELVRLPGQEKLSLVAFVKAEAIESVEATASVISLSTPAFRSRCQSANTQLESSLPPYMVPSAIFSVYDLPLTTGGKLDRKELRRAVESLSPQLISGYTGSGLGPDIRPLTVAQQTLHDIWATVLNKVPEEFGIEDSFFRLGGDSISAMQVVAAARKAGLGISTEQIIRCKTIASLITSLGSSGAILHAGSVTEESNIPFALSPIQQLFFKKVATINHFNQSVVLQVQLPACNSTVENATRILVQQHSMLRARFHLADKWTQSVTNDIDGSYVYREHDGVSMKEALQIRQLSQKSLNVEEGPLLAVDSMAMTDGTHIVSLVAHHLVVDIVSWNILLADFEDIMATGSLERTASVPFSHWLQIQAEQARVITPPTPKSHAFEFWEALQYWGLNTTSNCSRDVQEHTLSLPAEATSVLLGRANDAFGTRPVELIHAAILHSFAKTFPDRSTPTIWSESHGRDSSDQQLDLTSTVGWFTEIWPTHVDIEDDPSSVGFVSRVKDGRREAEAGCQKQYLASCCSSLGTDKPSQLPDGFEILFNFSGSTYSEDTTSALIRRVSLDESPLADLDEDANRFALFDVLAEVIDSKLDIKILSNRNMRHSHAVATWVSACKQVLLELVSKLPSTPSTMTRSDFPLLRLTEAQMSEFQAIVQKHVTSRNLELMDAYPCSPIQRGILISQAKNPGEYIDTLGWKVRPKGAESVDISRLFRAWQHVVNRHPLLRSFFVQSCRNDGSTDQIVLRGYVADVHVIESSEGDPLQTLVCAKQAPMAEMHPQHRFTICQTDNGDTACLLLINHAIVDGLSGQIMFRDLKLAYDNGLDSPVDIVYQQYIAHIQRQPTDLARTYWSRYTDKMEPCLFPKLARVPAHDDGDGAIQVSIPGSSSLAEFCQRNDFTVALVCQLAWGLVLRAYTGSDDVSCGYITSGREIPIPAIQDAIGPFINMLVRRMSLDQDKTLLELLQQFQLEYVQGLNYQFYSLAEIVHDKSQGLRGALFNTTISVQKEVAGYKEEEASLDFVESEGTGKTEYDLVLDIGLHEEQILVDFKYRGTVLTLDQAHHVMDAFSHAIHSIVSDPHHTVGATSLLAGRSEEQILRWNNDALSYSPSQAARGGVAEVIRRKCLAQPQAPAVCAWDGNFTYAELDALSGQLAAVLAQQGAGPEVFVPICFEKSRWTVVAILAVLKAGAAFVMLDPSQPVMRLDTICKTTGAALIISSELQKDLAAEFGTKILTIGDHEKPWTTTAELRYLHETAVSPDNALYAVFTSGSTGKPKGVVIEHRNYLSRVHEETNLFKMGSGCRVLQFTAYTWDASILDHLHGMVSGSCLCIPSDKERQQNLPEAVARMEANWVLMTPSMASTMACKDYPTLRNITLGGESITQQILQKWESRNIAVAYGPAECTITAGQTWVSHNTTPAGTLPTPVQCRIWLTDPDNHEILQPFGAVGEILIEGPNVGRGYLEDAEKTKMAFIEPPSWLRQRYGNRCHRVYKTGDLAQYLDDGRMVFNRRKDTQIKLRGQRIELGEVEYQVRQCFPSAQDLVVDVVTPVGAGRAPILVAFVWVDDANQKIWSVDDEGYEGHEEDEEGDFLAAPTDSFREAIPAAVSALHDAVPAYMVPTVFLPLRDMPLSISGKTDRRRLSERAATLTRAEIEAYCSPRTTRRAPATAAEQSLQKLWSQVLGIESELISADDSFFRIGGDSIAAINLVNTARSQGLELSVSDIFALPQLSMLATALKTQNGEVSSNCEPFSLLDPEEKSAILDLQIGGLSFANDAVLDIMPATHSQIFFLTQWAPSCFSFSIQGTIDVERLRLACHSIMEIHPVLRTTFFKHHDKLFQAVLEPFDVPLHHIETEDSLEPVWRSLCTTDSKADVLSGQPIIKFTLLSRSETEHLLTVRLSHAQYDGFSKQFILRDLMAAYDHEIQSGPVCATFPEYVYYCANNRSDAAFEFWRNHLQGSTMTMLPYTDLQEGQVSSDIHEIVNGDLPTIFGDVTMPALINAAFAFVLASLVNKDDVVFGVVTNTRVTVMPQVQTILGPCINLNPLRSCLANVRTVSDLCMEMRDQYAESLRHCHLGLSEICDNSTDWPPGTKWGCLVNHLGTGEPTPSFFKNGTSISDSFAMGHIDLQDQLLIRSIPGNGQLQIQVLTSDRIMNPEQAKLLAKRLIDTANLFASSPEAPLPLLSSLYD